MLGHFMMNMIMHLKITEQLSQADSTQTTTIIVMIMMHIKIT